MAPLSRGSVRPAALLSQGRALGEPGGDLLFRPLRGSTIGAEGFHGRVRDGIGCFAPRYGHQAVSGSGIRSQGSGFFLTLAPVAPDRSELCGVFREASAAV